MIQVFKIPPEDVDFMRTVIGSFGSTLNMVVVDILGNTIIGQEEYNASEFDYYKTEYPTEIGRFVLIDYEPIPLLPHE